MLSARFKMWRFLLYLSFTVVISTRAIAAEEEEVKHNLPDNLEIIDPKSLGLSDSDVEKFLGNVKLLPIGGDMGNNVKTQILTVGFEGDEKLDLADFDIPNTDGLPDKDKEVAQTAFRRFQDFFKKPGSSVDFDKVIQDSEKNEAPAATASSAESSSSSTEVDTTTPYSGESGAAGVSYADFDDSKATSSIESPPQTTEKPVEANQPVYSMNAEEVIRLLKTSGTFDNLPGLQKFGGFLTGPSSDGRSNTISGESYGFQSQTQQSQQSQQSVQKEQVYSNNNQNEQVYSNNNQNELRQQQQQQQPSFVQSYAPAQSVTPVNNPPQAFQILTRPAQAFVQPHHQQVVTPFIIQQRPAQSPQQQQNQAIFQAQQQQQPQQAFTTIQAQQPQQQQQTQQAIVPVAQIARQPIFAPQQVVSYAPQQQVPVAVPQQQQQYYQPQVPVQQYSTLPQQYQNLPQQQQSNTGFPQPISLTSQLFSPPNRFAQNFTPSRGPPQDSAPVTPRPGFVVTPSVPMIPISTAENAIHHPPVVRQHLHQQQSQPSANNNNPYLSNQEHLDIVAKIAQEQHLRISQQPAVLPTHPGQNQQQPQSSQQQHQPSPSPSPSAAPLDVSGKHGGREISQLPLKHSQQHQPQSSQPNIVHHGSSSPVIQQQPQQQQYQQQQQYYQQNPIHLNAHNHHQNQQQQQQQPQQYQQSFNNAPPQQQQQQQQSYRHQSQQPTNQPPLPPPTPAQRPQYQQQFSQPQYQQQQVSSRPIQPSHFQQPASSQSFQVQNYQRPSPQPPSPAPQKPRPTVFTQARKPTYLSPVKQPFQKPVNTRFPPQPPSRPSPPITRFYFPPARQNIIFKTQNPGGPHIISRPTSFFSSPSSSNFRPNSLPNSEGNFGKSRFPSSRPDPSHFRAQFAPPPPQPNRYAYSTTSSASSTSIQASASELRPLQFGSRLNGGGNNRDPLAHHSNNNNNGRDLLAGGSDHSSTIITRGLFKPEFIESIQPSRMVAYRYLTSAENNSNDRSSNINENDDTSSDSEN